MQWHPSIDVGCRSPAAHAASASLDADEFWGGVFGRRVPVEIEIGAGRGVFLFAAAAASPDHDFLAIEHSASRAAELAREATARNARNVRVLHADAACVVATIIPTASVAAYHIYFPDPWWKRRHHQRRLFTSAFVATLARTAAPGGHVQIATDVPAYFEAMTALLAVHLERDGIAPAFNARTRFAEKAAARGAPIYSASFCKVDRPKDSSAGR